MRIHFLFILLSIGLLSCDKTDDETLIVNDPETAEKVLVDRFSDNAANLMRRSDNSELPEAGIPVDFDNGMFATQSYGPAGQIVKYYNFDVQPELSAPLYVLRDKDKNLISNQLNIIDVIPGESGYNDFWQMVFVEVPDNYKANSISSAQQIFELNLTVTPSEMIVNCPVAPYGSTARYRYNSDDTELHQGWYKNKAVYYFTFEEHPITRTASGVVPNSPIYVTFNINPDPSNPQSGPASGIVLEENNLQSHNVIATIPGDDYYSPLWSVTVFDNADFNKVSDLPSVQSLNYLATDVMLVNCPVYSVEN